LMADGIAASRWSAEYLEPAIRDHAVADLRGGWRDALCAADEELAIGGLGRSVHAADGEGEQGCTTECGKAPRKLVLEYHGDLQRSGSLERPDRMSGRMPANDLQVTFAGDPAGVPVR